MIGENANIHFTKNLKITFDDGKYYIYYDLYGKCSKVYNNGYGNNRYYTCADDIETYISSTEGTGKYTIDSDEQLTLKIDSGNTRKCKIITYSNTIDCTESGGWIYEKIDSE